MSDPRTARNRVATIDIEAPASAVFAIVSDPRQHARIDGSGTVVEAADGPQRLKLGSEFGMRMKRRVGYTTRNTVVEFEPDRLIAWRHSGNYRWRYELTSTISGRTRVTETWDVSPQPAPVRLLLSAVLGQSAQRALEATLLRLKSAAEADAGG